jgi:FAD/FMN-containing dehydrogenase
MTSQQVATAPNAPQVSPAIDEPGVAELRARFRGSLLRSGDPDYEQARRVWNGMIDRRPALIVRCAGAADVIRAVDLARERGLPLAVRGGGHNVAGNAVCDGGLVIDLSGMKAIRVDPARRTARAEGGVTWGEFDRETQAFGLATTGGIVSTTGIAGLTLGGGIGWLARSYGLASDNLLAVDLVTAEGQLRTVSATEHADLFWGLRGGGGNFGVATSLEFRLHPVGPVVGGLLIHPFDAASDLLRLYRDFTATTPPQLTCFAVLTSSAEGAPVAVVAVCYHGRPEDGERLLRPLRAFGSPLLDGIGPMPYTALQSMLDPFYPSGRLNYWKSSFLTELGDGAIDTMLAHCADRPTPLCHVAIEQMGGATSRVDAQETAFAHRERPYNFLCLGVSADGAETEACVRWARRFWEAMQPFASGGVYVNYLGAEAEEGAERVRAAYGAAKYERLAALKAAYDPTNLFRMNQNIRPGTT